MFSFLESDLPECVDFVYIKDKKHGQVTIIFKSRIGIIQKIKIVTLVFVLYLINKEAKHDRPRTIRTNSSRHLYH